MNDKIEAAHAEHLAQAQDHYRWHRDHMEALACCSLDKIGL